MKLNMSKMIFVSMITLSTLISLSVNNWLTMWILMEITLFMFIPMMSKNKINDQSMKYFIIQSTSSYIFIFSIIMNSLKETNFNNLLTMISLLMKIGMAPFHIWKPEVMKKLKWMECLMLTTLIKITPMILINKLVKLNMMMLPMLLSLVMGSVTGLNQLNLKKMMAYSSIFNLPWMTASFLISKKTMLMFLTFYFFVNFKIMKLFKINNLIFMNQMTLTPLKTKFTLNLAFLSISGLPPLTGFFPKWIILNELIKMTIILPSMMIVTSSLTVFMYLQMNTFTLSNFFVKKKAPKTFFTKNFSIINLLMFPLMLTIWNN